MKTIPINLIRKLAVAKQRLVGQTPAPTLENFMDILQSIRCLQIDPIRAVERTQYLVMFSRLGNYDQDLLSQAAYREKIIFEYWAHAASYVLTEDYPIHKTHMADRLNGTGSWTTRAREWLQANPGFQQYVLETLQERGPLSAREIEDRAETPWKSGGWTSGANGPMMVDFLWTTGQLMVAGREGLRKTWDLTEHVLPDWVQKEPLSKKEATYLAAQISLKALGVGNEKQIKNHFVRFRYPGLRETLKRLEKEGLIEQVEISGDKNTDWEKKGPWYIHRDDLPLLESLESDWQPRTVLLSPFDNLICDRERTEMFWDFYFRIEIYVPAKKREYGYYVLPILHGEKLIGRIDPKMDRKKGVLHINNIYAEADAPMTKKTAVAVRNAIEELAQFLGAGEIQYGAVHPEGWRSAFA